MGTDTIETITMSNDYIYAESEWEYISDSLPIAVTRLRSIMIYDKIFIAGGLNITESPGVTISTNVGFVVVLDVVSNGISEFIPLNVNRSVHTFGYSNLYNELFIFGGLSNGYTALNVEYIVSPYTYEPTKSPTNNPTLSTQNPTVSTTTNSPTINTISPTKAPTNVNINSIIQSILDNDLYIAMLIWMLFVIMIILVNILYKKIRNPIQMNELCSGISSIILFGYQILDIISDINLVLYIQDISYILFFLNISSIILPCIVSIIMAIVLINKWIKFSDKHHNWFDNNSYILFFAIVFSCSLKDGILIFHSNLFNLDLFSLHLSNQEWRDVNIIYGSIYFNIFTKYSSIIYSNIFNIL